MYNQHSQLPDSAHSAPIRPDQPKLATFCPVSKGKSQTCQKWQNTTTIQKSNQKTANPHFSFVSFFLHTQRLSLFLAHPTRSRSHCLAPGHDVALETRLDRTCRRRGCTAFALHRSEQTWERNLVLCVRCVCVWCVVLCVFCVYVVCGWVWVGADSKELALTSRLT